MCARGLACVRGDSHVSAGTRMYAPGLKHVRGHVLRREREEGLDRAVHCLLPAWAKCASREFMREACLNRQPYPSTETRKGGGEIKHGGEARVNPMSNTNLARKAPRAHTGRTKPSSTDKPFHPHASHRSANSFTRFDKPFHTRRNEPAFLATSSRKTIHYLHQGVPSPESTNLSTPDETSQLSSRPHSGKRSITPYQGRGEFPRPTRQTFSHRKKRANFPRDLVPEKGPLNHTREGGGFSRPTLRTFAYRKKRAVPPRKRSEYTPTHWGRESEILPPSSNSRAQSRRRRREKKKTLVYLPPRVHTRARARGWEGRGTRKLTDGEEEVPGIHCKIVVSLRGGADLCLLRNPV